MSTLAEPPSAALTDRHAALLAADPGLRQRDVAHRLGIPEADVVARGLGLDRVDRLRPDWAALLPALSTLGSVMALTRNDHCVHERHGRYEDVKADGAVGLVLGPDVDLRLFLAHWHTAFAVRQETRGIVRESLQFFDRSGTALHKVHMTDETDRAAWACLVARFLHPEPNAPLTVPVPPARTNRPRAEVDAEGLRAGWQAMTDTHQFHDLLRRFDVARLDALRLAPPDRATRVDAGALNRTLTRTAGTGQEIMIFVGNPGIIQIHTGPVHRTVRTGPWFNVLDPAFNLHLREDAVAEAWIVSKPTDDGDVTSLELFAADGTVIAMLFGARKPGRPEDPEWRAVMAEVAAGVPAGTEFPS